MSKEFQTLQEFILAARNKLSDHAWEYIIGGTETEMALRRNRLSLDQLALRPRVLNDVSEVDCTSTLFGAKTRLPVILCPIGGLELFDADGAKSVARAARDFGAPMMLSSVSQWSIEMLKQSIDGNWSLIFQLYAREDANSIDSIVDRTIALDLPAFCITVDSARYSRRERDIISQFKKPWRTTADGDAAYYQAALNWKDIERIRRRYSKPMILKGIATAEDALIAVDHGIDIIHVSNHGGRQLDHVAGSTQVLPEVLDAVQGRAQVFVDGGYYRGTDIAKAMALGADGVGLGRMMCLSLAAAGPAGIVRMLELLEIEFRIALALLGVTRVEQLNSTHVQAGDAMEFDHALNSAFPLLGDFKF